jgi:hypothetical protein
MSQKTPSPIDTTTMSLTYERPTRYDLPTLATLQARQAQSSQTQTEERGAVTELELMSLNAIDAAEMIAEPLSRGNIARASIKSLAYIARLIRLATR